MNTASVGPARLVCSRALGWLSRARWGFALPEGVTAAQISEQAVVLIPFRHRHRRQAFEPMFLFAHPAPGIERCRGARDRFGVENVVGRESYGFSLAND